MKTMMLALTLLLIGCGAGKKTAERTTDGGTTARGVTALLAEDPGKLRVTVTELIGEGPDAAPALEIIDRYETDLRFVFDERSVTDHLPDSAAVSSDPPLYVNDHRNDLANIYGAPQSVNAIVGGNSRTERVRRFSRNSLSIAIIGLNECHQNFMETGDDRFARRGLAHGYIALISDPSPAQKSRVIEKLLVLQEPLLKR